MIEKTIIAKDGHQVQVFIWACENAKGWVHIYHGMAEHALRYDDFAKNLVLAGYAVVAHNHRGHGTGEGTALGIYKDGNGWQDLLPDVDVVRNDVCDEGLPYFIFAHSMGSFVAQSYLTARPKKVAGVVLSGSNFQPVWLSKVGKFIAKIEAMRLGKDKSSGLLQFLSFGSFNQKFKPNRTEYDWLSRDTAQVDKYVADPLCGFACSTGFWGDFFGGLIDIFTPANFKKISADLPLFIMGGSQDPVGEMGVGLSKLHKAYEANGQKDLTFKLFEKSRHEIVNETNNDEVYADIISWLQKH